VDPRRDCASAQDSRGLMVGAVGIELTALDTASGSAKRSVL
jgi:hypothetical protein